MAAKSLVHATLSSESGFVTFNAWQTSVMLAMTVVLARLILFSFNAWQTKVMLATTVVARLILSPLTLGKLKEW